MLSSLLNLLFPFQCCGCKRYGAPLCSACARTPLARNTEQLPGIFAPFSYRDPRVQTLIHRFKYQGEWALAPFLAALMVEAFRECPKTPLFVIAGSPRRPKQSDAKHRPERGEVSQEIASSVATGDLLAMTILGQFGSRSDTINCRKPVLVPVPLHPSRLAERGYNQSEKLANALSEQLKIPVASALKRVRAGTQQALLSKEARQQNIRGAFHLADPLLKAPSFILLVDDVVTTGATLAAATTAFPPNIPLMSLTFAHQALQTQETLPQP